MVCYTSQSSIFYGAQWCTQWNCNWSHQTIRQSWLSNSLVSSKSQSLHCLFVSNIFTAYLSQISVYPYLFAKKITFLLPACAVSLSVPAYVLAASYLIMFVTSVSMLLRSLPPSPPPPPHHHHPHHHHLCHLCLDASQVSSSLPHKHPFPIIRVIVILIITIAIIVITIVVMFPSLRSKVSKLLLAWLLLTIVYIFPEAGLVLFMAIHHWVGCSLDMFTLLNISRGLLKYFWPGLTCCFKGVEKEKVLFWNLFWWMGVQTFCYFTLFSQWSGVCVFPAFIWLLWIINKLWFWNMTKKCNKWMSSCLK